jgi:DNA-binding FrmR family transcriptional regulator
MAEQVRSLSSETRDEVSVRLRRIEGQIRGVQRMVDEGRDCRDLVNQIAAIKAALGSVNAVVLQCYATNCLEGTAEASDTTVAELIDVMMKGTR